MGERKICNNDGLFKILHFDHKNFPLHKAVAKMSEFYEQNTIDLLKETLTLSGAAIKILHRSNKGECTFF